MKSTKHTEIDWLIDSTRAGLKKINPIWIHKILLTIICVRTLVAQSSLTWLTWRVLRHWATTFVHVSGRLRTVCEEGKHGADSHTGRRVPAHTHICSLFCNHFCVFSSQAEFVLKRIYLNRLNLNPLNWNLIDSANQQWYRPS